MKLDDYFRPGERVDLIKLDIQGYELHALRGAERLLQERAELKLLLECWPYGLAWAGGSTTQLHGFLRQRGPKIGRPFLNRRLEDDNFPDRSRQFPNRERNLRLLFQQPTASSLNCAGLTPPKGSEGRNRGDRSRKWQRDRQRYFRVRL